LASAVDYSVVALIGAAVAAGELITRYRDAPIRALRSRPAVVYIALNVLATTSALALIRLFDVRFGLEPGDELRWTRVLVAGFGAMTILRTSLFITRIGDQDVGLGPSTLLQAGLAVADRGVDRRRAKARAEAVSKAMAGVSFADAYDALPTYCFALMQNVSREEQQDFADRVVAPLKAARMHDSAKAFALGLALMNLVGEEVLAAAAQAVRAEGAPSPRPETGRLR
jgi:hypothetical protein